MVCEVYKAPSHVRVAHRVLLPLLTGRQRGTARSVCAGQFTETPRGLQAIAVTGFAAHREQISDCPFSLLQGRNSGHTIHN